MKTEQWHRRHAIMIASQLPENAADALLVLGAARELVGPFLDPPISKAKLPENVLPFKD
jgi:hypothetical protein